MLRTGAWVHVCAMYMRGVCVWCRVQLFKFNIKLCSDRYFVVCSLEN